MTTFKIHMNGDTRKGFEHSFFVNSCWNTSVQGLNGLRFCWEHWISAPSALFHPLAPKQLQNMMLPPPCSPVGTVFWVFFSLPLWPTQSWSHRTIKLSPQKVFLHAQLKSLVTLECTGFGAEASFFLEQQPLRSWTYKTLLTVDSAQAVSSWWQVCASMIPGVRTTLLSA